MLVLEDVVKVHLASFEYEYELLINKLYLEIVYWLRLDTTGMF